MVKTRSRCIPPTSCWPKLDRIGVPAGRIRTIREVYEWEQTKSQGLLIDVEHATLGSIALPGPPLRFFDADGAELTRRDHTAPPVLGADNDLIAATSMADHR